MTTDNEDVKWELPENNVINPPMFAGEKERDFQKQIGDEMIERVMNQVVIYYAIDHETTNYHSTYGEAIHKTFFPPIKTMCVVEWLGEETTTDEYNMDKRPKIRVYFPTRRINEDRGIRIMEGDYLRYGRDVYEIVQLNEDQELYGTFKYKVETVADCVKARSDIFDVEEK